MAARVGQGRAGQGQRSHVWRMAARTISEFRGEGGGEQQQQQHQYRARRALERVMTNSPWEKDGQEYMSEKYETGTLLHYAAAAGDADSLTRLIALGCKLDEPNWDGQTPYDVAEQYKRHGIMMILDDRRTINLTDVPYRFKKAQMQMMWNQRNQLRNLRREYESLSRFEYKEALREMVDRHKESVMMLDSEWSPQLPPAVFEELRALRTRF